VVADLSWSDVMRAAGGVADRWRDVRGVRNVYGVPRGGIVPAVLVAHWLGCGLIEVPSKGTLVVDDVVDSGMTLGKIRESYDGAIVGVDALYRKSRAPAALAPDAATIDDWLVFPWERMTNEALGPADAVVRLLEFVGEDPAREGLRNTPARVVRALSEMTRGYSLDPAVALGTTFVDDRCDEMVVCRGIDFTSLCEHHLLPFSGDAVVGYVPGDRLVGLSKLARLVEVYAQRLQVQERLTVQIADALTEHLAPRGVGVVVRARHSCMACRGVRKQHAEMVTSALSGFMRDDAAARAEFLALARADANVV
jgi:GTP cyclohydrolase I